MIEYVGYFFMALGVLAGLLSALALLKFPDVYTRLLVSTKCVTLGMASLFFGVFIMNGFTAAGVKALLCVLFILITSPVEAHVLLRAARKAGIPLWKGSITDTYAENKEN
jgi:multicomponent Na+:H+ antiporter subunit G